MSNLTRAALVGVAVIVAVVAFVALRPDDADRPTATNTPPPAAEPSPSGERARAERPRDPVARARPVEIETIEIRAGEPVGGARTITAEKGDTLRLAFASDEKAEVHIHGFDRYVDVGPGRNGRVTFKANLEGIFEIENHDTETELATLEVSP